MRLIIVNSDLKSQVRPSSRAAVRFRKFRLCWTPLDHTEPHWTTLNSTEWGSENLMCNWRACTSTCTSIAHWCTLIHVNRNSWILIWQLDVHVSFEKIYWPVEALLLYRIVHLLINIFFVYFIECKYTIWCVLTMVCWITVIWAISWWIYSVDIPSYYECAPHYSKTVEHIPLVLRGLSIDIQDMPHAEGIDVGMPVSLYRRLYPPPNQCQSTSYPTRTVAWNPVIFIPT